ncbi:MAG: radical SAM protein, partial [Candidatus Omnitrophica bacterium]|nr:radical SAM protein [Candidatus Omnitrophota bacterium]MCG2704152.1 radical SAM protein [Candidatus Omnitrophota bacterium]
VRVLDFDAKLIDYFIIGDGELALYKLLRSLDEPDEFEAEKDKSCKVWKDDPSGKPVCLQEKTMDLDALTHPTFEEFDLSTYAEHGNVLPIIFSKGCSRHCVFCADTVICAPLRLRSPKKVVEEIKFHLKRLPNIKRFRLNDLGFNADLNFLDEFCERIIKEGIKISWKGQAQIRPDMGQELLVKMKKAGCQAMELGVENFSDNVLALMKKQYTGTQAVFFLKAVKEAGIGTELLFIIGFPGETREDFYLNLEFIKDNASYIDRFNSLNICGFPIGCELFANPEKFGYFFRENEDWQTYDGKNTWQERKWRLKELTLCCRQLGIPFDLSVDVNMHEEILKDKSIKLIS